MAPRAFWKGYLKLSLVTCPVETPKPKTPKPQNPKTPNYLNINHIK